MQCIQIQKRHYRSNLIIMGTKVTPQNLLLGDIQGGGGVRHGDHPPPHKYIYMWNNSYRTPTERWQKTSDLTKGKKLPTYLGRAKEKRKTRDKRIGTGPAPVGGNREGEKFPHTRKPLHGRRLRVAEGGSFRALEESAATGVRRAKRRDSRMEDRCRQHSPAREACLLTRRGGRGWELRLRLRRSDPRERTGAGGVNTD